MDKKKSLKNHTLKELKKFNLFPKKDKGQNFLIEHSFLTSLVEGASVSEEDTIFEIGPGTGNLTAELARRGAEVIALEKDKHLIPLLKNKFKDYGTVEIMEGDIKKTDLKELLPEKICKVVANLPYYLTNHIIVTLLENKNLFKTIVLTIQLEVAERLTASAGTKSYGSITLFSNYHTEVEIIEKIPPEAFFPAPKVHSAIIKMTPREAPPVKVDNEELFFSIIRSAFNMRRKTLKNALTKSTLNSRSKEDIEKALASCGICGKRRGESLSLEEFALLANSIH